MTHGRGQTNENMGEGSILKKEYENERVYFNKKNVEGAREKVKKN